MIGFRQATVAVTHPSRLIAGGWQHSLMVATAFTAGVRLFLTVYFAGAALLFPRPGTLHWLYDSSGVKLLDSGWQALLLGVWQREDAIWYEKIATLGYSTSDMTVQFFPLYPLLTRWLSEFTGLHAIASGMLVSDASLIGALFLLHRLVLADFGLGVANRTVAYISLFPFAFFLHAPFAESLALVLVILAFFLLSRQHWLSALAAAYLVGLVRPQGMVFGLPLAVQVLAQRGVLNRHPLVRLSRRDLARVASIAAAPLLGAASFMAAVNTPWRTPGVPATVGPMAHQWLTIPGTPLLYSGQRILQGVAYPIDISDFVMAVLFVLLSAVALFRLRPEYSTYAVLFVLLPLSRFSDPFPLMSFSRYMLLLFPCFIVLALLGRYRWVHLAIIFLFLCGLAFWSAMYYTASFVG